MQLCSSECNSTLDNWNLRTEFGGIYVNRIEIEDEAIGEIVDIIRGSIFDNETISFDEKTNASIIEKLDYYYDAAKPDPILLMWLN